MTSTGALCTCRKERLNAELHDASCAVRREHVAGLRSTPEVARELLLDALVALVHRADWSGLLEAERLVEALGWTHPSEMPDSDWVRARLAERVS